MRWLALLLVVVGCDPSDAVPASVALPAVACECLCDTAGDYLACGADSPRFVCVSDTPEPSCPDVFSDMCEAEPSCHAASFGYVCGCFEGE